MTDVFVQEDLRLFRVADEDEQEQRRAFDSIVAAARASGLARAVDLEPSSLFGVVANAFSAPIYDAQGDMICALSMAADASMLPSDADGFAPQLLVRAANELSILR